LWYTLFSKRLRRVGCEIGVKKTLQLIERVSKMIKLTIIFCLLVIASLGFSQVFPPVWQSGPFPTGTEEIRNDSPANTSIPDELGTIYEYTAYRGTPEIDGIVNGDPAWGSIPWTPMSNYTVNGGETTCNIFGSDSCDAALNYGGAEDISAYFKVLWDDDNVYFALYKVDDQFVSDTTHVDDLGAIWQDDAYQIVLDANAPTDQGGALPSAEIGLALLGTVSNDMSFVETAYNSFVETNGGLLELADGDGASEIEIANGKAYFGKLTTKHVGYTEIIEVAFKRWDAIVADTPQMFSIMANDPDGGHGVDALQWGGGIFGDKSPSLYASIVYSSSAAPVDPDGLIDITDLGGTIVGSHDDLPWGGENSGSPDRERVEKVIDNDVNTKYLVGQVESWIDYEIDQPALITSYSITSANDAAGRDPMLWELLGWDEAIADWVPLSFEGVDGPWERRFMKKTWTFENDDMWFSKYRLEIYELNGDPEGLMQMAELELLGKLPAAVEDRKSALPSEMTLQQNYPNPFNPTTTISYDLHHSAHVQLTIYDALGRQVNQLVDGQALAGQHSITWNGTNDQGQDVAAGLYFCRMQAGDTVEMIKLALVK
jgi:hypothetical protein